MTSYIRSLDTHLVENRRNRFGNPRAVGTTGYAFGAGAGGAGSLTNPSVASLPTWMGGGAGSVARATWTAPPSGSTGHVMLTSIDVLPGEVVSLSAGARLGGSGTFLIVAEFLTSLGAWVASIPGPPVAATAGVWARLDVSGLRVPATGVGKVRAFVRMDSPPVVGVGLDVVGVQYEKASTTGSYLDGALPASGNRSYTWAGAPNASESIEWLRVPDVEVRPLLVEGYEGERIGGSIVHPILGRTVPDVTLRPAGLRTGTLSLLFSDEAAALDAWTKLAEPRAFEFVTDERSLGMTFVVPEGERLALQLDDRTRDHWHLRVPYQEVSAL